MDEPHNRHHTSRIRQEKHQIEVAEFLITSDPDGASAREDRSTILSSIVVSNHQDHNFVSRRVCIVHRPQDHAGRSFFLHQKQRESKNRRCHSGYQDQGEPVKDVHTQSSVWVERNYAFGPPVPGVSRRVCIRFASKHNETPNARTAIKHN